MQWFGKYEGRLHTNMMTSSNGKILAVLALCGGIHWSPVNSIDKGRWGGALMFYFICAWVNGRVNNREAGDLRRLRAHFDVIVIKINFRRISYTGTFEHDPIVVFIWFCF